MFRGMRRFKQLMPEEATIEILEKANSGVLAVLGDEDYPYTVPMSYVYDDGKLYFHSAVAGHKNDAIKKHDKASFCVVSEDEIIPEKYTTYYRSAVAFGRLRFLEDKEEIRRIATILAKKYSPGYEEGIPKEIDSSINHLAIIEMEIDHLTGKEAIELVKQRNNK